MSLPALHAWRRDAGTLEVEASVALRYPVADLVSLPGSGRVAVIEQRAVSYRDASTLLPTAPPAGAPLADDPKGLWTSSGQELLAVATDWRRDGRPLSGWTAIDVHDLRPGGIPGLLTRPMANARPEDLTTLTAAEGRAPDRNTRELLGLIRDCLQ